VLGGRRSWVRGSLFRAIFRLLNFGAAERVLPLPAVFLFARPTQLRRWIFGLPFKLIRSGVSLAELWRHFGPTFLEVIQRFR